MAIADITATLVTDFDLPSILQLIADYALTGCEASSVAIVVLDVQGMLRVAAHAGTPIDPALDTSGPARDSARNSVTAMVDNWNTSGQRWERHRAVALANGFIGLRAFPVILLDAPVGSVVVHTASPEPNTRERFWPPSDRTRGNSARQPRSTSRQDWNPRDTSTPEQPTR